MNNTKRILVVGNNPQHLMYMMPVVEALKSIIGGQSRYCYTTSRMSDDLNKWFSDSAIMEFAKKDRLITGKPYRWGDEIFEIIDDYDPDLIFWWNGVSVGPNVIGQVKTHRKVVFCEVGFFPQREHLYLDTKGINYLSSIRDHESPDISEQQKRNLQTGIDKYKQRTITENDETNTKDYIFIPLQLENDSQISIFSEKFKKMEELVGFVGRTFPNEKIIVKPHPLDKKNYESKWDNVEVLKDVNTHLLIKKSRYVIGINSTVLLESLLYDKAVGAFGKGIFTGKNVLLEAHDDINKIKDIYIFNANTSAKENFLYDLIHNHQIKIAELGSNNVIGKYSVNRENVKNWFDKNIFLDRRDKVKTQPKPTDTSGTGPIILTGKPKFSIVMANYNNENYIAEAIESVLDQTFKDWELIIIEDCSTDDSLQIINHYLNDKRIRLIRHDQNRGYVAALKTGIENVRSEYFGILDSDDCLMSSAIETMYSHHVRFRDCGLIYSQFVYCDEKLKTRQIGYCSKIPAGKTNLEANVVSSFKTFKMKDYLKTSGYDEDILYAEDKDISYKMEEVTRLKFVNECLYLYRVLPNSQARDLKKASIGKQSMERARMAAFKRRGQSGIALDYFLKAREELNGENFETAIVYMQQYRSMIDYSRFPRILNKTGRSSNIDVSVIIVTYNRTEDLKKCLESLSKQGDANFEVIIVDNGGSDFEVFQQYVDQYIKCPINFILSEGRNIGACCAKGKIIAFLDDDALVPSNYVSSIKSAFDQFDIFGLRGRAYPKSSSNANNHLNIYDLGDRPFPSYCNQEGNSAWLFEVYKSMDGMDPLLFGHEGSDLTFRIIKEYKQPNKIIYWPHAIIYHDYGTADKLRLKKRIHQRNTNYLKYKHNTDIFVNRKDIEKYPLPLKQTQVLPDKASSTPEGSIFQPNRCARHPVKPSELPEVKYPNTVSAASTSHLHPRVSIIISCYNCENFLPECLESIRNQTMNDWELFLLDDASTDGTRSIIEKYAQIDERIKPYYFRDNRGPYVRRNFAIERANSDFIVIQDADDIMYPPKLEILYNEIAKDERLEVVGSFYRMCLEKSKGLEYADKIELPITHDEIMQQYSLERYVCWHGSAIIRKSMFEQIGLYDEHPYGSDKFWLAKAAEYARCNNEVRFKNVPEYLTLKREHSSSQQGLLPTLDPRSRRARFQTYWEYKLLKIREKLHNNPDVDIKAELRNCKCNNYIKRYGCLFEQWERQPLDNTILCRFISRGVRRFNEGKYVRCIIILDSVEKIINDITKRFKNYDLLRAMAHFKIDRKQQCLRYLNREIQNHNNPAAGKFLSDYFEKNLRVDVQNWCSQNSRHYNLQLVDLENESCQQRKNNNISEPYVSEQQSEQKGIQQSSCCERSEPLVSVIMPAYNAQKFITEAIQSVLSQTYRNFELVVVDDGSTDGTKDIVFSFKDERIKYFYHENSGLAATHNTGIKNSKGLFLVKLDSDDMMTANFIAAHLAEFEKHPDVDLVYCDDCLIEENSNPIRVIERPEYTDRRLLIRDLFHCGFPVVPFRTCIRRSVFDKIGFFDEDLLVGEDYDMMRRFVKHGLKIHHLKGALYLRRMTSDSLSRNYSAQKAKSHFDVVKRFTDTFTYDELFPDVAWDEIEPQLRQLHAKCLTAGTYLAIGQEYVKTNATEYSRIALDLACSELNDCVKMDPKNQSLRQLSQKFKLIRAKYTEAPQQVVS